MSNKGRRLHEAKSDFGIQDYYKFFNNKYKVGVNKQTYKKIINDFNQQMINLIIEENLIYRLPYINMEVVIKKDKRKPKIKDGKVINNAPVNWKVTNELWENDEEAKEKKIFVRHSNYHTSGYVFRIYCKKFKCKLKYRSLYKFKPNRKFTRQLSARLLDENKDNLDAYLLY
jgi:hypothetical protein